MYIVKILAIVLLSFFTLACKKTEQEFVIKEKEEIDRIVRYFNDKSNYIYEMAKLISLDKDIVNYYSELKKKIGNFTSALNDEKNVVYFYKYGYELKNLFEEKISTYEKGLILNVHFIIPPGRSWLKANLPRGEDITLTDILKEEPILQKVLTKGEIYTGYQIINGDIIYSSILPIWNEKGEILGCVEVSSSLQGILNDFLNAYSQKKLIVFIDQNYKDRFKIDNLISLKNSIIYYKNMDISNIEAENLFETIKKSKSGKLIVSFKNIKYLIIPLKNLYKEIIGYITISLV